MNQKIYKKTISCLALSACLTMYSCQKEELQPSTVAEASSISNATQAKNKIEGQYIVVLKKSNSKVNSIVNALIAKGILTPINSSDLLEGAVNGFVAKLTPQQVIRLEKHPDIAYIEQDQFLTSMAVMTTDSAAEETYIALPGETVPQGVSMLGYEDGTGKTAWVIDSGVDLNNSDLNVDVTRSKSFLTTTSVQDGFGHGTAVASIIGAKNNGSGIIGVAANASIVALRVSDDAGAGTVSNAIKAVNQVNTYGKAGDVVNISLASGASAAFDSAVKSVAAKGIFVAIAAGNSGVDCSTTSPQRVNATNVYTVSAMDYNKNFWASSNFGAPVDRCAPGVNIIALKIGSGTKLVTGTSFAAPHVAGLLLLKGNAMSNLGYVTGDKDSTPDLIPHL
ncbi:S8 family serine peptidase [Adhaeribacter radiodurans]|uniref:S8 family serine peptidase n=1 Tax=Adhaeribacter radiodurans TaxID=2745197 RepID=A0A7L7L4Z3_9BACT|nr:S8 family serine peptidase [Adhaeribacter radiodurans]QMU27843.1 S8 family serine peptidase [Adhaeribacter radiodurans]